MYTIGSSGGDGSRRAALALGVLLATAFAIAGARPSGAAAPFQDGTVDLGTPDAPWSVQLDDVDRDGDLDVLTASLNDGEVSWFENDGGAPPAFTARTIPTTTAGPSTVYAADVDGDGDRDLVVGDLIGGAVFWYESDGAAPPAFVEHTVDLAVPAARAVFAADIDSDGDVDLLSASELSNEVAWYESDGASPPGFTKHVIAFYAFAATSVSAADVDGDGDVDVLSTSENDDTLAWYENDGASPPGFTRFVISAQAGGLWHRTGDLDGDGDLDVAAVSVAQDSVTWFENDGASPPGWTGHLLTDQRDGARGITVADLDGDGDLDIASASEYDDTVAWHENDGSAVPVFDEHVLLAGADGASSVTAGDVDGDGDPDVLSVSFNDDHVRWYENRSIHGDARLGPASALDGGAFPGGTVAADLDRNGAPDLLVPMLGEGKIRWYESDGAAPPAFTARDLAAGLASPVAADAADVDGDGDIDAVSASLGDGAILWHESDGASPPGFVVRTLGTLSQPAAVETADLDRDGAPDVVVGCLDQGAPVWYRNLGGSPASFSAPAAIPSAGSSTGGVAVADLDADGAPDVLRASAGDQTIAWHESDGASPPTFTEHVIAADAAGVRQARAADLDGDGDLDVLAALPGTGQIVWYESDGAPAPSFTPNVLAAGVASASGAVAADVDRDGDLDVLAATSEAGALRWYENDGASPPGFSERTLAEAGTGARLLAADLDRDGYDDVVVSAFWDGTVGWHRNTGGALSVAPEALGIPQILENARSAVLALALVHEGRPGESDAELASLALRFEKDGGAPFGGAELDALLARVQLVADDGSGVFEDGVDALVAEAVAPFPLVDGVASFAFADGLPAAQVQQGAPRTWFVVLETQPGAASAAVAALRVVHAPGAGSAAEDAVYDLPVRLAAGEGGTPLVTVVSALPACSNAADDDTDGFADFPDDPQCQDALDDDEASDPPQSPYCGLGFELVFLLPPLLRRRGRGTP